MNKATVNSLDKLGFIYFSFGLTCKIINQVPKKKMYFYDKWSQLTTSKFDSSRNAVVVRTGPISDCFVIDIDDMTKPDAAQLYELCYPICSVIVKTKKGYHFYFKYDDVFKSTKTYTDLGFDIKGINGIITAPPSYYFHPTEGKVVYEFIKISDKLNTIPLHKSRLL